MQSTLFLLFRNVVLTVAFRLKTGRIIARMCY